MFTNKLKTVLAAALALAVLAPVAARAADAVPPGLNELRALVATVDLAYNQLKTQFRQLEAADRGQTTALAALMTKVDQVQTASKNGDDAAAIAIESRVQNGIGFFLKHGNNGTVSCQDFCMNQGGDWGPKGFCVGAFWANDKNEIYSCGTPSGKSEQTCVCGRGI